ncbi:Ig-like domain-containing protein [Suttonella sp. R2A3]|uniref:beta strand repeat-containing protein n=1 Tax=Suttonella sp. R2A3 TaxID=2908648 RepID=UPI001F39BE80|nr:Ig-like domain-containing protein [Suttonella sp. R2A3]UJF25351.1 Ig-like domain-containing protein [Suttonella sp. R2A3]
MTLTTNATIHAFSDVTRPPAINESVWVYIYESGDTVNPIKKVELVPLGTNTNQTLFEYNILINGADAEAYGTEYVYQFMYINSRGNISARGIQKAESVAAPEVTIVADADNDGMITAAELSGSANQTNTGSVHYGPGVDASTSLDKTVAVSVKIPSYAQAGDTIQLDNGTSEVVTVTLEAADISAGAFTVRLSGESGSVADLTAKWFGQNGSTSLNGSDQSFVNSDSEIVIDPITEDNVINAVESEGTVTITGKAQGAWMKPGDEIKLTINGTTYAGELDANNQFSINVPGSELFANTQDSDGNGQPEVYASVVSKDPFGNEFTTEGSKEYSTDTTAPSAPTVTITEDVNDDGFVNAEELEGEVDVTIGLPAGAKDGDTVTVTDSNGNTKDIVLTATDITNGSINTTVPAPAADGPLTVTATVTDKAGNTSPEGSDSVTVDTGVPGDQDDDGTSDKAPEVTITTDGDNSGSINKTELDADGGKIKVKVDISGLAHVEVDDTVVLTDQSGAQQTFVLTASDKANGYIEAEITSPAEGSDAVASAYVIDPAGNKSKTGTDSATLDTNATEAPTVKITEDVNDDGFVNAEELEGEVDVTIGLPAGAKDGDTVTVTDSNGNTKDIVLTATDITNGSINTTVPAPAADGPLTVTATVTDKAGNTSPEGSDSVTVDTGVPGDQDDDGTSDKAPEVTITTDGDNSGSINKTELDADGGKIKVKVDISGLAHVEVDDTVVLTDQSGAQQTFVLTASDKANGYIEAEITSPAEGSDAVASAYVIDPAGNKSKTGTDSATLDTNATEAPTVKITEDVNDDGFVNAEELEGEVDVTIGLPAGAKDGDTVTVTDSNGNTKDIVLTATDITNGSINTTVPAPAADGPLTVTATVTDKAGNTSPEGSDSVTVDTGVPGDQDDDGTSDKAPEVTITTDGDNSGSINKTELDADGGKIKVKVDISGLAHVEVDDTVVLTDQSGAQQTFVLTASDKANGYIEAEITSPAEGSDAVASAYVIDPAGNKSKTGTDSATLDTNATEAPTVKITEDTNGDGIINQSELQGDVDAIVNLPSDAVAGDTLVVTDQDGVSQEITLTVNHIQNGSVAVAVTAPNDGETVKVTAVVVDPAGNVSDKGYAEALIDISAPDSSTTQIAVDDVTADNVINAAESAADVAITGVATGEFQDGDKVVLTIDSVDYEGTVDSNGRFSIDVAGAGLVNDADQVIDVTFFPTDVAGNTGTVVADKAYGVDVTIDVGTIDAPDQTTDTTPTITGQGAEAGATVSVAVTDPNGNLLETLVTTVAADGTYEVTPTQPIPVGGYTATATVTDVAGNSGNTNDDGSIKEIGKHYKVFTVASSWNSDHGPVDYGSYKLTEGDDWIEIGNGSKNCWTWGTQGNIWNKAPWHGWAVISTGGGDDRIDTGVPGHQAWWGLAPDKGGCGSMFAYTKVDMGTGNDTFNLKGSMVNDAIVDMGSGDDVMRAGGFLGTNTKVDMGSGNDTLEVNGSMLGWSKVLLGDGDNSFKLHKNMVNNGVIKAGSGNDEIYIDGFVGTNNLINSGEGNDKVIIGSDVLSGTVISTEGGNDTISIGRNILAGAKVFAGDGDDSLHIGGNMLAGSMIDMGSGDDSMTIDGYVGINTRIEMGDGNDTLSFGKAMLAGSHIDMGFGDDTLIFTGKTVDGKLHGGEGQDTLVLDYNGGTNMVTGISAWKHVTNISTSDIDGFEIIKLNGPNALDIRYKDLLQDTTRDGALFVQSDDIRSKVDLGSTDWNSDRDMNLRDAGGGSWAKVGSENVGGITYDVYHHSSAGTNTNDDVYIQQGITVI